MKKRRIVYWAIGIVAAAVLGFIMIESSVALTTGSYRIENIADVPAHRVAIVFGALVYRNGTLSPILQDRVDGGVALYKAGKVQKLLLSGDNHTNDYNEVHDMQLYAIAQGVPSGDITLDYAGFSTYDSCYRAVHIFGLSDAILVTERYHAPRAVYTCRSLGMDAVAYALPDFEKYPDLRVSYSSREYLADIKAWFMTHVTYPEAEIMGQKEPAI